MTQVEIFAKGLEVRIKREKAIAIKNGDAETAELMQKISDTFTWKELDKIGFLISPLIGMSRTRVGQANMVSLCNIRQESVMKKALRTMVIEAVNIYQLSRKTKDYIISTIIKGRTQETGYYYEVGLAVEKVNSDSKAKNPKHKNVSFTKIKSGINKTQESGGNFFDHINSLLIGDEDTQNYFNKVQAYAKKRALNINKLTTSILKSDAANNSPIAINGFLSMYDNRRELIGGQLLADNAMSRAIVDLGVFLGANLGQISTYSAFKKKELEQLEQEDDE